jgi:CTP synthase
MKYIFITGGVLSALGKGICASAIGTLLEAHGITVNIMKLDPYINVDPGTMSPFQHGEVYVTEDGAETDLDLGHYERFTTISTKQQNNITTGRIYYNVISKERQGAYLGQTVQVVPHIIDEIKSVVYGLSEASKVDVLIVEVGGTVGDIESMPFLEAIRQIGYDQPSDSAMYIHITLVPYHKPSGELKSKPTQHSVKELRAVGIQPNILLCRTEKEMSEELRKKIAIHCSMCADEVIPVPDVENVYEVPINLYNENLDELIIQKNLKIEKAYKGCNLSTWEKQLCNVKHPNGYAKIAIVGKYTDLTDAYKSLIEAIRHGGWANKIETKIVWVDAEELVDYRSCTEHLMEANGILVPGGFGERGIEGKIKAVEFARRTKTPFLGICLGMQCAIIEFARNIAQMPDANSTEFTSTIYPVIHLIEKWFDPKTATWQERDITSPKGGTLRLGNYPCRLKANTLARSIYGIDQIEERHRHRYEVNNLFLEQLSMFGLIVSGKSPDGELVEIVELDELVHPFFFGCQYHPEFNSRFLIPHPVFIEFVLAARNNKK